MPDRKSAAGKTGAKNRAELWFSRLIDQAFAPEWGSEVDERAYAHLASASPVEPTAEKPRE